MIRWIISATDTSIRGIISVRCSLFKYSVTHLDILHFSSKWVPGGAGDVPHQGRRFIHPDGPQLGSYWNSQSCVAFDKLKLTNSRQDQRWDLVIMIELLSWLILFNFYILMKDSSTFNASLPTQVLHPTNYFRDQQFNIGE